MVGLAGWLVGLVGREGKGDTIGHRASGSVTRRLHQMACYHMNTHVAAAAAYVATVAGACNTIGGSVIPSSPEQWSSEPSIRLSSGDGPKAIIRTSEKISKQFSHL